ncbi:hypothetical protein, partial [Amycolatopsis lurida]
MVTQVLLLAQSAEAAGLSLVRYPGGEGVPLENFRQRTSLDATYLVHTNQLLAVHEEQVRAMVEGAAERAWTQSAELPLFHFEISRKHEDNAVAVAEREQYFTDLVREGISVFIERSGLRDHEWLATGQFMPRLKVEYTGSSRGVEVSVHALVQERPEPEVRTKWHANYVGGRNDIPAGDQAELDAWFRQLARMALVRHDSDERPPDLRPELVTSVLARIKEGGEWFEAQLGKAFADAVVSVQGNQSAHVELAGLGLTFPVGKRKLTSEERKRGDGTGWWVRLHPDPPVLAAAVYRDMRVLERLEFVPGLGRLVDAAVWDVRQVVSGAVRRAIEQAQEADEPAVVEPITVEITKNKVEPVDLSQRRLQNVRDLVNMVVDEELAEGTLPAELMVTRPLVRVEFGSAFVSGQKTVARLVIGGDVPQRTVAHRVPGTLKKRRQKALRESMLPENAGSPGLQVVGYYSPAGTTGVIPSMGLQSSLDKWAEEFTPLARGREENDLEPFDLHLIRSVRTLPDDPQEVARLKEQARDWILRLLEASDESRRPVGHPGPLVSVTLKSSVLGSGLALWVRPDVGGSVAGYRAMRMLNVVFESGEVELGGVAEWKLGLMFADAAERAKVELDEALGAEARGGELVDLVTQVGVSVELVAGRGEETLSGQRGEYLTGLAGRVFGELVGDRIVPRVDVVARVDEWWPRGVAAASVRVGDGVPHPVPAAVVVPGVSPLVVPSWTADLNVRTRKLKKSEVLLPARRAEEEVSVTFDPEAEPELVTFIEQIVAQWKNVSVGAVTPNMRIRLVMPSKESRHKDDVQTFVEKVVKQRLRALNVDTKEWVFSGALRMSAGLDSSVTVSVMPSPVLTEKQVREASYWEGDFHGDGNRDESGKAGRYANELPVAVTQQLGWRVHAFADAVLSRREDKVLAIEILSRLASQFSSRQGVVRSVVREALPLPMRDRDAFIERYVRFVPTATGWALGSAGVGLRVAEVSAEAATTLDAAGEVRAAARAGRGGSPSEDGLGVGVAGS